MADVEFSPDHVGDEHGQRLGRTPRCTNGSGKVNGNELRTVDVVEKAHLADAFQRRNEHRFREDRQANTKANVNRFLKVVTEVPESASDRLGDDDRCGFTIVLIE